MSRPVKRSFTLHGHRTSISLEAPFWEALRDAAEREGLPLASLVAEIDEQRRGSGLSCAVRVWILQYFQRLAAEGPAATGNDAKSTHAPAPLRAKRGSPVSS